MAVSVIPALIDALVAQATSALPNVLVEDGQGVTEDPGANGLLLIGCDDPDADEYSRAATSNQTVGPMGTTRPRDERGSVFCSAVGWNGNKDAKAARDMAYSIVEAVATLCRNDPTLGLSSVKNSVFGAEKSDEHAQAESGAIWVVRFSIDFFARI